MNQIIQRNIILLAVALLMSAGCSKDVDVSQSHPPTVRSVFPADGSYHVDLQTNVTITLSDNVDPSSATASTLYLQGGVPGSVSTYGKMAIFTPSEPLDPLTTYTAVATRGLKNTDGTPIPKTTTWSFTTEDYQPVITSLSPRIGYPGTVVTILGEHFNETTNGVVVTFGGAPAALLSGSLTEIVAEVPDDAQTGPVTVGTFDGTATSDSTFEVVHPGDYWHQVPSPTGFTLTDVAWSGSRFVAVGNVGTIITSVDGLSWESAVSPVLSRLNAVSWTGAEFIAVGTGGTVLRSIDGFDWRQIGPDTTFIINDVVKGDRYVLVGEQGQVYTAVNLSGWSRVITLSSEWLYSCARLGRGYVAVGHAGTVLHSIDGQVWLVEESGTTDHLLAAVEYLDQVFAVGEYGTVLSTTDGESWVAREAGVAVHLGGLAVIDSMIFAVGTGGTVISSEMGINWQLYGTGIDVALMGVAGHARRWVVVGEGGMILTTPWLPSASSPAAIAYGSNE